MLFNYFHFYYFINIWCFLQSLFRFQSLAESLLNTNPFCLLLFFSNRRWNVFQRGNNNKNDCPADERFFFTLLSRPGLFFDNTVLLTAQLFSYFAVPIFFQRCKFSLEKLKLPKITFCTLSVLRSERYAQKCSRTVFEMSKKVVLILYFALIWHLNLVCLVCLCWQQSNIRNTSWVGRSTRAAGGWPLFLLFIYWRSPGQHVFASLCPCML